MQKNQTANIDELFKTVNILMNMQNWGLCWDVMSFELLTFK